MTIEITNKEDYELLIKSLKVYKEYLYKIRDDIYNDLNDIYDNKGVNLKRYENLRKRIDNLIKHLQDNYNYFIPKPKKGFVFNKKHDN